MLGYDVADYYLRSWLRPLADDEDLWEHIDPPTHALDDRGLFRADALSDAQAFVEELNAKNHSGWCVFAIWDLGEAGRSVNE